MYAWSSLQLPGIGIAKLVEAHEHRNGMQDSERALPNA